MCIPLQGSASMLRRDKRWFSLSLLVRDVILLFVLTFGFLFEFRNLVFVVFEVCALVALIAREAVIGRFALGCWQRERIAIVVAGEIAHRFAEDEPSGLCGKISCDAQTAEVETGAARVHARRRQGLEDMLKRDLDSAAVFERRKGDWLVVVQGRRMAYAVKSVVVIAVRHISQGR